MALPTDASQRPRSVSVGFSLAQVSLIVNNLIMPQTARSEAPGASHGAGQHPVGLLVVEEFFFLRVPLELPAQPYGNIIEVADYIARTPVLTRHSDQIGPAKKSNCVMMPRLVMFWRYF